VSSKFLRRGRCDPIHERQEPLAGRPIQLRGLAQLNSDCFPMTIQKLTTLQEAKSIARHLRLTLRKVRSGHYRVNFRDRNETTAYYTDNLEDVVKPRLRWPVSESCELHRLQRDRTDPSSPALRIIAEPAEAVPVTPAT
jgi:hypothetical protein